MPSRAFTPENAAERRKTGPKTRPTYKSKKPNAPCTKNTQKAANHRIIVNKNAEKIINETTSKSDGTTRIGRSRDRQDRRCSRNTYLSHATITLSRSQSYENYAKPREVRRALSVDSKRQVLKKSANHFERAVSLPRSHHLASKSDFIGSSIIERAFRLPEHVIQKLNCVQHSEDEVFANANVIDYRPMLRSAMSIDINASANVYGNSTQSRIYRPFPSFSYPLPDPNYHDLFSNPIGLSRPTFAAHALSFCNATQLEKKPVRVSEGTVDENHDSESDLRGDDMAGDCCLFHDYFDLIAAIRKSSLPNDKREQKSMDDQYFTPKEHLERYFSCSSTSEVNNSLDCVLTNVYSANIDTSTDAKDNVGDACPGEIDLSGCHENKLDSLENQSSKTLKEDFDSGAKQLLEKDSIVGEVRETQEFCADAVSNDIDIREGNHEFKDLRKDFGLFSADTTPIEGRKLNDMTDNKPHICDLPQSHILHANRDAFETTSTSNPIQAKDILDHDIALDEFQSLKDKSCEGSDIRSHSSSALALTSPNPSSRAWTPGTFDEVSLIGSTVVNIDETITSDEEFLAIEHAVNCSESKALTISKKQDGDGDFHDILNLAISKAICGDQSDDSDCTLPDNIPIDGDDGIYESPSNECVVFPTMSSKTPIDTAEHKHGLSRDNHQDPHPLGSPSFTGTCPINLRSTGERLRQKYDNIERFPEGDKRSSIDTIKRTVLAAIDEEKPNREDSSGHTTITETDLIDHDDLEQHAPTPKELSPIMEVDEIEYENFTQCSDIDDPTLLNIKIISSRDPEAMDSADSLASFEAHEKAIMLSESNAGKSSPKSSADEDMTHRVCLGRPLVFKHGTISRNSSLESEYFSSSENTTKHQLTRNSSVSDNEYVMTKSSASEKMGKDIGISPLTTNEIKVDIKAKKSDNVGSSLKKLHRQYSKESLGTTIDTESDDSDRVIDDAKTIILDSDYCNDTGIFDNERKRDNETICSESTSYQDADDDESMMTISDVTIEFLSCSSGGILSDMEYEVPNGRLTADEGINFATPVGSCSQDSFSDCESNLTVTGENTIDSKENSSDSNPRLNRLKGYSTPPTFQIIIPPKFIGSRKDELTVVENKIAKLNCSIISHPPAKIAWYKNGMLLEIFGRISLHYLPVEETGLDASWRDRARGLRKESSLFPCDLDVHCELKIDGVTATDQGLYICKAWSSAGVATKIMRLTVTTGDEA